MPRTIQYRLWVDWDFNDVYTEETANLISATGSLRLAAPEDSITSGSGIVNQCTLTLRNPSGRYSSLRTDGALYADIQAGGAYHTPMYLEVSVDGVPTYSRVFTGILKIPAEVGLTSRENPTVIFDCRGRDEAILQKRVSTAQADFITIKDDGYTEEQITAKWLTDAGLTDGTDYRSQALAASSGLAASLDPGLFIIPWAWLDDESPIEDVWQLTGACGGRFYYNPDDIATPGVAARGSYIYENATHWLLSPHDTSQETLDRSKFQRLHPYYNDRELFKEVTVEISGRELLDTTVVWESDIVEVVPANSNRTIVARLRQPCYAITTPVAGTDFVAITSGGTIITSSVSLALTKSAQRVSIVVTNAHATQAANLVVFQLRGQAVDGRPAGESTKTSSHTFWNNREGRNRALRGNPYVQSGAQAGMLAEFLRDRSETPRLFFRLDGCLGEPDRRLGDRITISDTNTMSADRPAYIIGIQFNLSKDGFYQMLDCVDATSLYLYQDTTPDYFLINTDTLHATASARVFY